MFELVKEAPPDAILGLTEAFAKDPNPRKVNLGVGVYVDERGRTPILESVKAAERLLLAAEQSKSYLPIQGSAAFGAAVRELLVGADAVVHPSGRVATAHTPGGTAALRVAGDFLHKLRPDMRVWLSDPTWANHRPIFSAVGLRVETYPYFDPSTHGLAFDRMLEAIERIPAGDVVVLHGCCHNPSGVDLTLGQWERVARALAYRGVLPLVDLAYQGLGTGLSEDVAGVLALARAGCEVLICSSFSKNFGLYNERVGALTVLGRSQRETDAVMSQVKVSVRCNYSNPPAHGGAIVSTILGDAELRGRWEAELGQMRQRIVRVRELFVKALAAKGIRRDYSFLTRQKGMFSFLGLTQEQVETLRQKHGVYVVGSGRVNVAGLNESNIDRVCEAIAAVV
jgi:aspartate/tyrosine/aromatic aminotransferase